jgi:hypothetical protein
LISARRASSNGKESTEKECGSETVSEVDAESI